MSPGLAWRTTLSRDSVLPTGNRHPGPGPPLPLGASDRGPVKPATERLVGFGVAGTAGCWARWSASRPDGRWCRLRTEKDAGRPLGPLDARGGERYKRPAPERWKGRSPEVARPKEGSRKSLGGFTRLSFGSERKVVNRTVRGRVQSEASEHGARRGLQRRAQRVQEQRGPASRVSSTTSWSPGRRPARRRAPRFRYGGTRAPDGRVCPARPAWWH